VKSCPRFFGTGVFENILLFAEILSFRNGFAVASGTGPASKMSGLVLRTL